MQVKDFHIALPDRIPVECSDYRNLLVGIEYDCHANYCIT